MQNHKKLVFEQVKKLIPSYGVNDNMLSNATLNAGFSAEYKHILFPGGLKDLLRFIADYMDDLMLQNLEELDFDKMRVRDRIKQAVRIRLSLYRDIDDYQQVLRRILYFCLQPQNTPFATRAAYNTADKIWRATGDTSTDFNFYTKRFLLSAVYTSTFLYFIRDYSYDHKRSWIFLERRINNVLSIGKFLGRL
jgi:ubiquinone biosynthesis protein COQ9